jgi:hypothetical protein
MTDLVEEALSAPSLSVYEALPLNTNDMVRARYLRVIILD